MEQHDADPLPERGSARLPRGHDLSAQLSKTLNEERLLAALARAVGTLEGDENPPVQVVVTVYSLHGSVSLSRRGAMPIFVFLHVLTMFTAVAMAPDMVL